MVDKDRNYIIRKLERYKTHLENKESILLEELSRFQHSELISNDNGIYEVEGESDGKEYDIHNNPYETYLLAQIEIVKALPPLLEDHLEGLKKGSDLDMVLDSLEFEIYKIKKDVYVNIKDWEDLLKHLSDHRLMEIENNPKGPGDLIIKELRWIKAYEEKWNNHKDD